MTEFLMYKIIKYTQRMWIQEDNEQLHVQDNLISTMETDRLHKQDLKAILVFIFSFQERTVTALFSLFVTFNSSWKEQQ